MTVPIIWQAPHTTQLAAGTKANCGGWEKGKKGEAKRYGVKTGACGGGWKDGRLASVWKFLGVNVNVDPPAETPALGQNSFSSFSSFTVWVTPSSCFSTLISTLSALSFDGVDSPCILGNSVLEDLASVSSWLSSRDSGNPLLTLSISWKSSILLVLLPRPPFLLGFWRGVCVQASLAGASQLSFSLSMLSSAKACSSSTTSSLGSANLTSLVEVQDEHHSTRLGQLEDVWKVGSFFNICLRRWISSGLVSMELLAMSSSSPYRSSKVLLKYNLPSGGSRRQWCWCPMMWSGTTAHIFKVKIWTMKNGRSSKSCDCQLFFKIKFHQVYNMFWGS